MTRVPANAGTAFSPGIPSQPIGKSFQKGRHPKVQMIRGDEAESQALVQRTAQEGGDSRVRVDDVEFFASDQCFKSSFCREE